MAIDFIVLKGPLAAHPTGHSARVKSKGTISLESVTNMVANRRTTVAKSDVLSVLEDFFDTVEVANASPQHPPDRGPGPLHRSIYQSGSAGSGAWRQPAL